MSAAVAAAPAAVEVPFASLPVGAEFLCVGGSDDRWVKVHSAYGRMEDGDEYPFRDSEPVIPAPAAYTRFGDLKAGDTFVQGDGLVEWTKRDDRTAAAGSGDPFPFGVAAPVIPLAPGPDQDAEFWDRARALVAAHKVMSAAVAAFREARADLDRSIMDDWAPACPPLYVDGHVIERSHGNLGELVVQPVATPPARPCRCVRIADDML